MTLNLPNILTLLRLLAAPAIAVVFLYFSTPYADWFALVLFVLASLTDFIDGWLARRWKQETNFGRMLDPIADKAMVVIALMVLVYFLRFDAIIVLPATAIIFREMFVSGLREFLGDKAGLLKVTRMAKWKTTAQMIAIAVLFAQGLFTHYYTMQSYGMDTEIVAKILSGSEDDLLGLRWKYQGVFASYYGGLGFLWIAAILTLATGFDYLVKSLPYLRDDDK